MNFLLKVQCVKFGSISAFCIGEAKLLSVDTFIKVYTSGRKKVIWFSWIEEYT